MMAGRPEIKIPLILPPFSRTSLGSFFYVRSRLFSLYGRIGDIGSSNTSEFEITPLSLDESLGPSSTLAGACAFHGAVDIKTLFNLRVTYFC